MAHHHRFFVGCIGALLLSAWMTACTTEPGAVQVPGEADRARILDRMEAQEAAWNAGDLEGFMAAYWQSDSLLFVGSRGPSRGWATTLSNYRSSYPDRTSMGTLTFGVVELSFAGQDHALMLGSWRLDRTGGLDTLSGWFSLVWQKREGDWVIVRDHSS
ncbi:MAG: YybH family protein [Flavobacteriales bacterium]